ncbi:MAG TPA: hypothetical protein P5145_04170 [Tenuifilaceae bacterium]|nr:hypothetical protein [Tenuifilaceae bacterium]
MGNRLRIALAFLLAGSFTNSFSQSGYIASIKSKIDRDTILVGDQIYYTLVVNGQKGVKFQFPQVSDSLGNGVELVGKPKIDSIVTGNDVTITLQYLITAFDSGQHIMPNLPVVASLNGRTDSLLAEQQSFFVKPLQRSAKPGEIFDIKPPIREPITISEVAPWAGILIAIVAIVGFLIMYLESRKKHKPFLNLFKPAEPPHLVALRELNRIREDKLWNTENHKYYYTRLVDTLRIYLEGRFGINAPEQTTSEILSEINKVDYAFNGLKDKLQELLFVADLVKFAKHTPLVAENEINLNFAIDFVNKTKLEEEVKVEPTDEDNAPVQETIDEPKKLN